MKTKRKGKVWKRVLIILGVILLILLLLGGAAYLWLRHNMGMVRVSIGSPNDQTIVSTTAERVRGYLSGGVYTYHGIPYAEAQERFVLASAAHPGKGCGTR